MCNWQQRIILLQSSWTLFFLMSFCSWLKNKKKKPVLQMAFSISHYLLAVAINHISMYGLQMSSNSLTKFLRDKKQIHAHQSPHSVSCCFFASKCSKIIQQNKAASSLGRIWRVWNIILLATWFWLNRLQTVGKAFHVLQIFLLLRQLLWILEKITPMNNKDVWSKGSGNQ